jgi:acyl-CoA thioester hydrolase
MFKEILQPRFAETDALGHINNATLPVWFEQSRTPIFRIFVPNLEVKAWNLILAKVEVEYHAELFYGEDVEIRTSIKKIGNSSLQVYQEAWQGGRLGASGTATMVHFDHAEKKSISIPERIREALAPHLQA